MVFQKKKKLSWSSHFSEKNSSLEFGLISFEKEFCDEILVFKFLWLEDSIQYGLPPISIIFLNQ